MQQLHGFGQEVLRACRLEGVLLQEALILPGTCQAKPSTAALPCSRAAVFCVDAISSMPLALEVLLLLFAAGLSAGFVDSVAGGGGLIAVPALM